MEGLDIDWDVLTREITLAQQQGRAREWCQKHLREDTLYVTGYVDPPLDDVRGHMIFLDYVLNVVDMELALDLVVQWHDHLTSDECEDVLRRWPDFVDQLFARGWRRRFTPFLVVADTRRYEMLASRMLRRGCRLEPWCSWSSWINTVQERVLYRLHWARQAAIVILGLRRMPRSRSPLMGRPERDILGIVARMVLATANDEAWEKVNVKKSKH